MQRKGFLLTASRKTYLPRHEELHREEETFFQMVSDP